MIKLLSRIKLLMTYSGEIDELLKKMRQEKEDQEWEARRHHLKLCKKHQQERNRSHYSEKNCDYCKAIGMHGDDSSAETKYGITESVARANGYKGKMIDMPISFARLSYPKIQRPD